MTDKCCIQKLFFVIKKLEKLDLYQYYMAMATFLQWLLSSVPEVAIVERFDCTVKLLIILDGIKLYKGVGLGFNYNTKYH